MTGRELRKFMGDLSSGGTGLGGPWMAVQLKTHILSLQGGKVLGESTLLLIGMTDIVHMFYAGTLHLYIRGLLVPIGKI